MASRTLDEWCKLMDANDLPYAVAQTWDQLLVDKQAWASGCFYEMEYSNGNKRTMSGLPLSSRRRSCLPTTAVRTWASRPSWC